MKKKCKAGVFIVLLAVFLFEVTAYAEDSIKVMEVQDQGEIPAVFVKGIDRDSVDVTALVGNANCESVSVHSVLSEDIPIKTLILFDNSLSIPEASRESAKNVLSEIIAGRAKNEQFAVATFGEDIETIIDFTDDYAQLKSAIDEIEFQDRETYLTDVLYDLIKNQSYGMDQELAYKRIFVVSDGVDNKSLGYTKEELNEALSESSVPIYALGIYNKKKSNSEELSNMFALSRQTNAAFFLLDELEDPMTVVSSLAEDHKLIRIDVVPAQNERDGSEKTITFTISDPTVSFTVDKVRMPQEVTETAQEEMETVAVEATTESAPVQSNNNTDTVVMIIIAFISVFVVAVIIGIIILIVLLVKKRKKQNQVVEVDNIFKPVNENIATEYLGSQSASGSCGETVLILDNSAGKSCVLTLTDINQPAHSFSKNLSGRIVIGRSAMDSDICIDYDKSVSSKHCAIERRGNNFYLVDLGSSNGTYLDENKVLSEVEIYSGSIIKLGRVQLRVEMR